MRQPAHRGGGEAHPLVKLPAPWAARQMEPHSLGGFRAELLVYVSGYVIVDMSPEHGYPPGTSASCRCASFRARILCPRFRRDAMVPMEQSSVFAISS